MDSKPISGIRKTSSECGGEESNNRDSIESGSNLKIATAQNGKTFKNELRIMKSNSSKSDSSKNVVVAFSENGPTRANAGTVPTFIAGSSEKSNDAIEETDCFEDPSPRTPHSRNVLQFNPFVGADDALLNPRGRFQRCQSIAPPLELAMASFHGSFSSVASSLFSHHSNRNSKAARLSKLTSDHARMSRVASDQVLTRISKPKQQVILSKVMLDPEEISSQLAGLGIVNDESVLLTERKQKKRLHKPFKRPNGRKTGGTGLQTESDRASPILSIEPTSRRTAVTKERVVRRGGSSRDSPGEEIDVLDKESSGSNKTLQLTALRIESKKLQFTASRSESKKLQLIASRSESKKPHAMKHVLSPKMLLLSFMSGEDYSKSTDHGKENENISANKVNSDNFSSKQQSRKSDPKVVQPPKSHRQSSHQPSYDKKDTVKRQK